MADKTNKPGKFRPLPLVFTRWLFSVHRHLFRGSDENFEKNRSLEAPDMGYIYGQAVCPQFTLGKKKMAGVGCEIAATYNALRLLGKEVSFADILHDYEKAGYVMRGLVQGDMGTDPFSIGDFLEAHGTHAVRYTNYEALASVMAEFKNSFQVYILSFWNRNTVFGGLHTVAAYTSQGDGKLHVLNMYNDSTGERTREDLRDYIPKNRFVVGYRLLPS